MGQLYQLWDPIIDPNDPVTPYTPYSFIQAGHEGVINMSLGLDFKRKSSVVSIPDSDSVLDHYFWNPGPMDERRMPFSFRVFTEDLDAARDLLAIQIAPGEPKRLVYMTDQGTLWFTLGTDAQIGHTIVSANKGGTSYTDIQVSWRIRPDWRPQFSQASDVWGYNDGVWGTGDGVWGGSLTVPLPLTVNLIDLDNRGTAGNDLPTLHDFGPKFTLTGGTSGFGGTGFYQPDVNGAPQGGILIVNGSSKVRDTNGIYQPYYVFVPPVVAGAEMIFDASRQKFTLSGAPFRPYKPKYQPHWFQIVAGVINTISVTAVGTSPLTGSSASILFDWWKKRA